MLEDILSVEKFQEQFNQLWQAGKHGDALVLAHDFAKKLDIVADLFSEKGEYEYAEEFYLQAQKIYRPLLKMHPNFAANLNSLAQVYYYTGEYQKAEQLYQEALEVWRSTLGESHPYVAVALNNLAQLFNRIGQYEKAEPLAQQALAMRRERLKETQDDVAESLNNLAMLEYRQGKYQEAEPLFMEALELRRAALGEEHPAFATILNNLSLLYETKSDYQQALAFVKQASEIWRKAGGEKDSRFASSLNNMGVLYQTIGDYRQAEEMLQRALELRRELLPATDSYIGDTLNNLALLYQEIGKYTESEQCYREALTIYQSLPGDEHFEVAQSLEALASLLVARGDYEQAEGYYEQALDMTCHTLGDRHPSVARCLNSLAVLYKTTNQYDRAQETLEQALNILQPFGTDHPLHMLSLDNLAAIQYARGNYAQAETYYQRVLKQRREVLGEHHPDVAQSLNSLAVLYRLMGDNTKAQNFYMQALLVTRTALGEKHPDVAQILNNLAFLYDAQSDFVHEEELLQQAYEIWNETLPAHHPHIGTVLDNLATVHHSRGDYERAEQLFQQALTVRRATLGNNHLEVALSLNNLAVLYDTQGQWARAEPLYQEALTIQRQTLKDAHPDVAQTLRNLASLYAAMQRYAEALAVVQQAAAIDDQTIGQIFSIGSENQRLVYMISLQENIDGFLSLIVQHLSHLSEAVRAGFDLVLRRKAMSAEALLMQRDAILRGRYPELRPHVDKLTMLRSQIGQKILEGPEAEERATYQQTVDNWRQELEHLESELAHQIPEMDITTQFQRVDRQAIAMALPPGTFLIEFVYLNSVDFHAIPARSEAQWQPARYIAFVLKAQEPEVMQVIDLGEASFINDKVSEFRSAVMKKEPMHTLAREGSADSTGAQESDDVRAFVLLHSPTDENKESNECGYLLRRTIFDPLLSVLEGCQQLFLAPDGDLAWMPFEALPNDNGSYLIDDYQFTYLTTSRDVLRFTSALVTPASPALVIADPDFDLRLDGTSWSVPSAPAEGGTRHSGDLDHGPIHFSRLSGAQREGEKVANLLQTTPLLQKEVLDARIKKYRSPFILHIATHGFFLPDQLHEKGVREEERVGNRLWQLSGRHIENPLLRSGLVLAGVNTWSRGEPLPAEAEDGLLTAEDVASMDLTGTELAVLSACETGLGQVHIGEGIFGLRRAFALAGAKTLVMSLWKVDDQQTQVLMLDFYNRILQGQPRAEALREAQLALKKLHPHPYYWGAFICQGVNGPLPNTIHLRLI
jgi:tetratricopeptide (TPR) repeat protein/CHAT domain-containing protein